MQESINRDLQVTRALQELLAGRHPSVEDTTPLTGMVKAIVDALQEALTSGGVEAVHKAFTALVKDQPWLGRIASQSPEGEGELPQKRRIRFLPTSAFLNRPGQQWLIPNILPRDGLALVYGESGGFKSFLVMAWSFCIATGTPWAGRRVAQGSVAYIAAEGGYGIGKRSSAWLVHQQRFVEDNKELDAQLPVKWFEEAVILQDAAQLAELITALKDDFDGRPPVLVVIDTLSRCSPGAEESSNSDMATVLANADLIRQELQCTVLILHHDGKDKERGPRGASALRNNVETVILVNPTPAGNKLESIKAKDAPNFPPIYLAAQEIHFGPTPEDSSLVLVPMHAEEIEEAIKRPDSQTTIIDCLQGKQITYADLQRTCQEEGLNENTFKKAFRVLREQDILIKVGKYWQLGPEGGNPSELFDPVQEPA